MMRNFTHSPNVKFLYAPGFSRATCWIAAGLFLLTVFGSFAAPLQADDNLCSDTPLATEATNSLLDLLVPVLNTAWPSMVHSMHLDPWNNVWDGKIDIPCSYGGTYACGLQGAHCADSYVKIDVSTITGLSYLDYHDFEVTSIDGETGTGENCVYVGQGDGAADLSSGQKLTVSMDTIKVKLKCDWGLWTDTETLYSGSGSCTAEKPTASIDYFFEAQTCSSDLSPLILTDAGPFDLDLKIKGDVDCEFSPSYNPVNWLADILVPALQDEIVDALTPSLEDALESLVDDELPFPSTCGE